MDTPLLQALAGLQSAYERLGLDPHAQGEERASVWRVWAREHRLDDLAEAPLLRSVLALVHLQRTLEDTVEHLPLSPRTQLQRLQQWERHALAWNRLPRPAQRCVALQRQGKETVNACCLRRDRDRWKTYSPTYLAALDRALRLAEKHMSVLWIGDLNHRILLELVRCSPARLAPALLRCLPDIRAVPSTEWHHGFYERAVVCLLRQAVQPGGHPAVVAVLATRVLANTAQGWRPTKITTWQRRVASHLVPYCPTAARVILRGWLRLDAQHWQRLLTSRCEAASLCACLVEPWLWTPEVSRLQALLWERAGWPAPPARPAADTGDASEAIEMLAERTGDEEVLGDDLPAEEGLPWARRACLEQLRVLRAPRAWTTAE